MLLQLRNSVGSRMSHVTGHIIEFSEQFFFVPGEKYNSKSTSGLENNGEQWTTTSCNENVITMHCTVGNRSNKKNPGNRCINLVVMPLKTSLLIFLPVAIF